MNFRESFGLSGGANSFLVSLRRCLRREGVSFTRHISDSFDIAFLNALTNNLTVHDLRRIQSRGKPIIHRKVGYIVSGPPHMRSVTDGVIFGDRLQLDFAPFIHHTVFQSNYSRDTFLSSGFTGPFSVIHNGSDNNVFNQNSATGFFDPGPSISRLFWDGKSTFRFAIVTWSMDPNKGFDEYLRFDTALNKTPGIEIWFIGRCPPEIKFRNIRMFPPQRHRNLARLLKQCHGFIQMARFETCSNALIEAINCGLPVIYLDSGSAREIASYYGVKYCGCPEDSIAHLMQRYEVLIDRIRVHPYTIHRAASEYLNLFLEVSRRFQ
jgi:glycosyltransferase involved in cell wall biosynthesis